jgi:hypothetical protein
MRHRSRITLLAAAAMAVLVAGCGPTGSQSTALPAGPPAAPTSTAPTSTAAAGTHAGHGSADPAGAEPSAPLRAGERFSELTMSRPYEPLPPNGGTDDYRCFLIDPGLTGRTYLTGSQFLPQNAAVVHHAIFFRVARAQVPEARRLDAGSPGDGWTCFGGTGIGGGGARQLDAGADWVAAWAPGSGETLFPRGTGFELDPGSQVVMQVHYNLLATQGKATGTDRSGIRLRLMDGAAHITPLQTSLLPAPVELPCPAGQRGPLCDRNLAVFDVMKRFGAEAGGTVAGLNLLCNAGRPPVAGTVQHCDRTVHQAGTVYAVAGHMHLLGRSIRVELNPGTPRAQVLLDQPVYNFDDQRSRALPRPVRVKPGDTYRVTCRHDASLRQRLPQLHTLPPRYVVWGDGTSDEMCLGIVVWSRS